MAKVDVLVQISPKRKTVVQLDEEEILDRSWRTKAPEIAAVMMGWSIFDIEHVKLGLRQDDLSRLTEEAKRRQASTT